MIRESMTASHAASVWINNAMRKLMKPATLSQGEMKGGKKKTKGVQRCVDGLDDVVRAA